MPHSIPPPGSLRADDASCLVSAPGRVNLIGEHVDYCDGFVLPAVIGLRTWMAATPRSDARILVTAEDGARAEITPERGAEKWANYLRGVLAGFLQTGTRPPGMDVRIASTLPQGAGLASSAALCVAFASLLEAASGTTLEPDLKARLCQDAEAFAGVPSGCMDQLAAVHGRPDHALLIDCRSREVEHIPLGEAALLIVNTGVKHDLADGKYAERRAETEKAARQLGVPALRDATLEILEAGRLPELLHRRARHVIGEIQRTRNCAEALRTGDYSRAGLLMNASHCSLSEGFEVSCLELDDVAYIAQGQKGVFGCRMTGGGFGGCCVALAQRSALPVVRDVLMGYCREELGPGAGVIEVPETV
jgi:galactokinase